MSKTAVATALPPFDLTNLDSKPGKVKCPECGNWKSSVYFDSKGKPRCSACISGRPGKGGSHAR